MSGPVRKLLSCFTSPQANDTTLGYSEPNAMRRKSISAEKYDPLVDGTDLPVFPKSDKQRLFLIDALKLCPYFKELDDDQLYHLANACEIRDVKVANECIIMEGSDGDTMYLIEEGSFEAMKLSPDSTPNKPVFIAMEPKKMYAKGEHFGELAMMYSVKRAASIFSRSPGILWGIKRTTYRKITICSSIDKMNAKEKFLRSVHLFNELTMYEYNNIAYALRPLEFKNNECIIKEGTEADAMYFVDKGCVKCTQKVQIPNSKKYTEEFVKTVKEGDYFGELALLNNDKRAASVYAVGDTRVWKLSKDDFERLMGNLKDVMNRKKNSYANAPGAHVQNI